MFFFQHAQYWPILFICAAMLASAIIDWGWFRVPNLLTMPVIVLGWLFGLMHNFDWHIVPGDGFGGIGSALAGTAMGSLLLLPYMIGGMGAGDVKMGMGFGSWVGAFYGITGAEPGSAQGQALWIILYAQFLGILVGGVIAAVMIVIRGEYRKNVDHARAIVMDAVTTGSISMMHERAQDRKKAGLWHRLPYGVPMCIGFLGYVYWMQLEVPAPASGEAGLAATTSLVRASSAVSANSVPSAE